MRERERERDGMREKEIVRETYCRRAHARREREGLRARERERDEREQEEDERD